MISRSSQAIQNFQSVAFWQYHRLVSPPHGGMWYSQKQIIAALEVSKADLHIFMRQRCINLNQPKQYCSNHCKIGSKSQITTYHCTMKV